MTRIDFYILGKTPANGRELYACRLAEKAFKLGKRVFIRTASAQQTQHLDELLWTFRQGSFVPHAPLGLDDEAHPVLIGHDGEPHAIDDVLINLGNEVPLFFSRFERVAELVDDTENVRRSARDRFRFYRERGYALASHDINKE